MPGEISRSYSGPKRVADPSPRPWHYQEGADNYTHIVRTAENGFICQLRQDPYGGAEADARLIAAAPELLEVVNAFIAQEVDYMTINNLGDPEKQHNVKWARAVIAKVEGRPITSTK